MEVQLPTTDEIRAATEGENLIMKDIKIHHRMLVITKKVKLNEYQLKYELPTYFQGQYFSLPSDKEKGKNEGIATEYLKVHV